MNPLGPVILIVDDEPALLLVMSLYLKRLGYIVRAERTSERVWSEAERMAGELAAVVLDATLPGPRTEELARRLLAANPLLVAIMVSGYPVDMAALETVNAGRVASLQKPFTPEMLASVLRRMIAAQEEAV